MQMAMVGLGRMGGHMVQRMLTKGLQCVVHDINAEAMARIEQFGATTAATLEALVSKLDTPRVIWLMLPAAAVDPVLVALTPLLATGDIVIDGGNSHYCDDIRRGKELACTGIRYVDVGTSGGVFGLERGYCLMIGGDENTIAQLNPLFAALAPQAGTVPLTEGRAAGASTAELGFLHCGPHGAGHFVKMVHNGIEYGMMAAYAEGLNILKTANFALTPPTGDARSAPLRTPENHQYTLDLPEIAEVWRRGSVISSWLLDLTANALHADPQLAHYDGYVSDSGEGRWALAAALDQAVPVPVLSAALYARFSSRGRAEFSDKVLSAMRHQFGGHVEPPHRKEK